MGRRYNFMGAIKLVSSRFSLLSMSMKKEMFQFAHDFTNLSFYVPSSTSREKYSAVPSFYASFLSSLDGTLRFHLRANFVALFHTVVFAPCSRILTATRSAIYWINES